MRKVWRVLFAAGLAAGSGCVVHERPTHPHGGPPGQMKKVVVVETSHVCVDACGHYSIDGVWHEAGHRHGVGCGHYKANGKWIVGHGDDHPGKGKAGDGRNPGRGDDPPGKGKGK